MSKTRTILIFEISLLFCRFSLQPVLICDRVPTSLVTDGLTTVLRDHYDDFIFLNFSVNIYYPYNILIKFFYHTVPARDMRVSCDNQYSVTKVKVTRPLVLGNGRVPNVNKPGRQLPHS